MFTAKGVLVAPDELTPREIWQSPKQMAVLCRRANAKVHAGWVGDAATLCGHAMPNPEAFRIKTTDLGGLLFCESCEIREENDDGG